MKIITINLPNWIHHHLNRYYKNKSKFIRGAIEEYLKMYRKFSVYIIDDGEPEVNTVSISDFHFDSIDRYKKKRRVFSRAEFIRNAVIHRLLTELPAQEDNTKIVVFKQPEDPTLVRVPIDRENNEYKEYKIVRRLEY